MPAVAAARPVVLLVDDTPTNVLLLREILKDDYQIRVANNGQSALRVAHSLPQPDLILLDVLMPDMDGYAVLRELRADPATADIPVIFVSAATQTENELIGLRQGAVDFIAKPFAADVVKARIATHLALRQALKVLEDQQTKLLRERELVEGIIHRMRTAQSFSTSHLRFLEAPVERSNGDILLSTFTSDRWQWLAIGDFTGHGLPAAVAAPLISHIFYSRALEGRSLPLVIEEINWVMCRQLPSDLFMAACFLEISPDRSFARLWNAAMNPAFILADGELVQSLSSTLPPLGIIEEMDLATGHELQLTQAHRLYCYSDGVIEVNNEAGEPFGLHRLLDFLTTFSARYADRLPALLECLSAHRGERRFDDDITLVEVRF
jgi:CheY-like chemotaxis protein